MLADLPPTIRGGSRRVAKFLQESIFVIAYKRVIAFDFIWKVLLSTDQLLLLESFCRL